MAKKKLITLAKLKAKVQVVFNKYIRLRDSGGGFFDCMSCGFTKSTDVMNAGHYYAVNGYDGIRFDEENVNGECAGCNCYDESHLIGYGVRLEDKLGVYKLAKLHERAANYKKDASFKWDRSELEAKIVYYTQRIQELN